MPHGCTCLVVEESQQEHRCTRYYTSHNARVPAKKEARLPGTNVSHTQGINFDVDRSCSGCATQKRSRHSQIFHEPISRDSKHDEAHRSGSQQTFWPPLQHLRSPSRTDVCENEDYRSWWSSRAACGPAHADPAELWLAYLDT